MANLIRFDPFRWDPFKDLEEIGERFNRAMGRATSRREKDGELMTIADWTPTVDISEDDKEYLIKAEIPEVDKNDVKVTVQNGVLNIEGERKKVSEQKDKRFHRVERSYGKFVRSFMLPDDAAADQTKAEFKDGMLLVHLPNNEKAKQSVVEVKVA